MNTLSLGPWQRLPGRAGMFAVALLLTACATVMPANPPPDPAPDLPPLAMASPVPLSPASVSQTPLAGMRAPQATAATEGDPIGPTRSNAPRGRLDPDQDAARTSLWDRVRAGYALPDLDNELVRKWEQWYATRPDYVQRMSERGGRYLFYIVEEIERRNMPVDLALLPFIESAFNPQAMSRASASGMWQFMPATGKDFELRQNLFRDDRRDVLASTRAALDYLQRLHGLFGDWHLALAAYNWGQGNVQRAIDRNRRAGLGTGYTDLSMPDETRNYVPKLQAVKNIVGRPALFAVVLPPLENHPYFLSVTIERDIDVALAARLAGLAIDEFKQLNPQMNKPVILAAGTPQVLLPYDNANRFLHALAAHQGPMASWTAWVAPRTLPPAEAARLVGMPEAQLREINFIPPKMSVRSGSTLLVPRGASIIKDVSEHVADNAAMALAPQARPARRVTFKAGAKGDSVAAVARRYKLSPALVAQWNKVGPQAAFKAGQTVVVMLPAATAKPATAQRTTKLTAERTAIRSARPAARARVAQR